MGKGKGRDKLGVQDWLTTTYPVAQRVKNLPAMQETWVHFLGREYPLEKEMATHSSILAWKIPWTEEPGRLLHTGSQRVGHAWVTDTHTHTRVKEMSSKDVFYSAGSYSHCFVVVQLLSGVWLCDPMDCSTAGFSVLHYLQEFAQTHVRLVGDAIQPSHPLLFTAQEIEAIIL